MQFEGRVAGGDVFEKTPQNSPVLVVAGAGNMLAALDAALVGAQVGEEKKISLNAENAFGPRREELVRMIPLARFLEAGMQPEIGQVVELDGRRARVQSVNGGRVRVDFNHELAGKDLEYTFTAHKRFSTDAQKVSIACQQLLGLKETDATLENGVVQVTVASKVRKDANYFVAKMRLVSMLLANVASINKVEFHEVFDKTALEAQE